MPTKSLFKVIGDGGDASGFEVSDVDGVISTVVGGKTILKEQGVAIAAATGTADASAAVNLVIAELKRHGLIAT